MSANVASRHDPLIQEFYERLVEAGKPEKVALVVCIRKLLSILNAMMRDRTPWKVYSCSNHLTLKAAALSALSRHISWMTPNRGPRMPAAQRFSRNSPRPR
jgi:ketol-acid reductoisomerase